MFLDLEPAFRSLRVGAAIRCANLAEVCRQRSDTGNLDPRDDVLDLLVADRAGACGDDEARQPFGVPRRVIERDESAASDANQMESTERQEIGERMKIVRRVSRLRTGRGIGLAAAPAAPVERDHAIPGLRKCRDLRLPALARAGDRVHQHDRLAAAAGIGEPETDAWQRCELASRRRLSRRLLRGEASYTREDDCQKRQRLTKRGRSPGASEDLDSRDEVFVQDSHEPSSLLVAGPDLLSQHAARLLVARSDFLA